MCASDRNHHSNLSRSSAKRQSHPEVDMIKESEREKQWTKGVKGENAIWHESKDKEGERILVGGNEFSCQGMFYPPPSLSTLHIIM